ncbi:MAG: ABC transporter permease [Acidimicrobiia bacterium]
MNKSLALAVADTKITLRRSEALILNLVIPIVVLIAISKSSTGIEKALPFSYLQAVLATSMVSLGITTGFDRRFRVLVRLGTTPLGRKGLVLSKIFSLIFIQTFQLLIISIVALFLGWSPEPQWIFALPVCWIASCAFAGIALLIAGRVRAEANLGIQNLMYIIMLGIGSIGFSSGQALPGTLRDIVHIVPSGALHSILRSLAGLESFSPLALISLLLEAVLLPLIAARKFSFDEK